MIRTVSQQEVGGSIVRMYELGARADSVGAERAASSSKAKQTVERTERGLSASRSARASQVDTLELARIESSGGERATSLEKGKTRASPIEIEAFDSRDLSKDYSFNLDVSCNFRVIHCTSD